MPCIYETTNLYNLSRGIVPYRYVGSDQNDRSDYFGSSALLKEHIRFLGQENFSKKTLEYFVEISNKDLRSLESKILKDLGVRSNETYYNKNENYAPGCGVKGMKHMAKYPRSNQWKQSRKGWVPTEKTKKVWTEQRTGKKAKDSTKKLMSIQRSGEKNPNSLNWTVTDPTGHTHNIKALRAWCKENNYNYRIVYHSLHGWSSMKHGIGRGGRKKVQE